MALVKIEHCPLCGSNEFEECFLCEDYLSSRERFHICDCKQCGFRFTNDFPNEETIGRYYDSPDYISHSDSEKGVINKLYHFFRKIMLRRKVRLVQRFANNKNSLLDIGCGTGYFLHAAAADGFEVMGIEKSRTAKEHAISHFKLHVEEDLSHINTHNPFQVITLWHVLEHIENLNQSIEKIHTLLAEQGTLIVALPNHHSHDAAKYGKYWAAYDVPRHLWHFHPETVHLLMKKHGFKIVEQQTMPLDALHQLAE